MLTLLGSLLGFLGSLVPDALKLFRDRADRAHELQILDRQMDLLKLKHSQGLEEIRTLGEVTETRALYNYPHPLGVKWVDALSGSVRPCLTYAFFVLYCLVKVVEVIELLDPVQKVQWGLLLEHVWHEEDQALFAAVMSFWFGQRALIKFRR